MKFNKAIVAMILAIVMIMGLASAAMAEDALKMGVIGPFTGAAATAKLINDMIRPAGAVE